MLPKPWAWNYPAEAGAMAGFLWELEPRRRGSSYQRYHLVLREREIPCLLPPFCSPNSHQSLQGPNPVGSQLTWGLRTSVWRARPPDYTPGRKGEEWIWGQADPEAAHLRENVLSGLLWRLSGKESTCQCRRHHPIPNPERSPGCGAIKPVYTTTEPVL